MKASRIGVALVAVVLMCMSTSAFAQAAGGAGGAGGRGGNISRDLNARGIRSLHSARGRALARCRQSKRHAFRLNRPL